MAAAPDPSLILAYARVRDVLASTCTSTQQHSTRSRCCTHLLRDALTPLHAPAARCRTTRPPNWWRPCRLACLSTMATRCGSSLRCAPSFCGSPQSAAHARLHTRTHCLRHADGPDGAAHRGAVGQSGGDSHAAAAGRRRQRAKPAVRMGDASRAGRAGTPQRSRHRARTPATAGARRRCTLRRRRRRTRWERCSCCWRAAPTPTPPTAWVTCRTNRCALFASALAPACARETLGTALLLSCIAECALASSSASHAHARAAGHGLQTLSANRRIALRCACSWAAPTSGSLTMQVSSRLSPLRLIQAVMHARDVCCSNAGIPLPAIGSRASSRRSCATSASHTRVLRVHLPQWRARCRS